MHPHGQLLLRCPTCLVGGVLGERVRLDKEVVGYPLGEVRRDFGHHPAPLRRAGEPAAAPLGAALLVAINVERHGDPEPSRRLLELRAEGAEGVASAWTVADRGGANREIVERVGVGLECPGRREQRLKPTPSRLVAGLREHQFEVGGRFPGGQVGKIVEGLATHRGGPPCRIAAKFRRRADRRICPGWRR